LWCERQAVDIRTMSAQAVVGVMIESYAPMPYSPSRDFPGGIVSLENGTVSARRQPSVDRRRTWRSEEGEVVSPSRRRSIQGKSVSEGSRFALIPKLRQTLGAFRAGHVFLKLNCSGECGVIGGSCGERRHTRRGHRRTRRWSARPSAPAEARPRRQGHALCPRDSASKGIRAPARA